MTPKVNIRVLLLLCIVTIGAFVIALPSAASRMAQIAPDPTPEILNRFPTPNIPSLTPEMEAEAVSITLSHPLVQEIIAGRAYTTTSGQLWHGSDHALIGSGVTLEISPPGTFEKNWIFVQVDDNGHPVYPVETDRYRITDASDFIILVDLITHQVASITPGLTGTIDYLGTRTPPSGE